MYKLHVKEAVRAFCATERACFVHDALIAVGAYTVSAVEVNIEFFFVAYSAVDHVV